MQENVEISPQIAPMYKKKKRKTKKIKNISWDSKANKKNTVQMVNI